jgi:hypothetical protein
VFTDSLDTGGGLFLDLEIMSKKGAGGKGEEGVGGELNIGTPDTCPPLYALTLLKRTHKISFCLFHNGFSGSLQPLS